MKNVLCIFSNVLGGKTFSLKLKEALDQVSSIKTDFYYLEETDYRSFNSAWWRRLSSTLNCLAVAKCKFKNIQTEAFQIIFIQSFELVALFKKNLKSHFIILHIDTTPLLAQKLIRQATNNILVKIRSHVAGFAMYCYFFPIFKRIDHFIVPSLWCLNSLVRDFKIPTSRITVARGSFDLSIWHAKPQQKSERLKLLFVGNDFARKGGQFLLKLFNNHLSHACDLIIVSNDPTLNEESLHPNISIIKGIHPEKQLTLIKLYQDSDLFVFPTRRDQLALVISEAIATGLPVIATDIGGISELVQDDITGYLMRYTASEKDWADRILFLNSNRDKLNRFKCNCQDFAERELNSHKFVNTIANVLAKSSSKT